MVVSCVFLSCAYPHPDAMALDTSEVFAPGLSDIEVYYRNRGGQNHIITNIVGYGASRWWNPYVSFELNFENQKTTYTLGLANFSTVYSADIDVDISVGLVTQFKSFILEIGTEVTYPMKVVVPYFQSVLTRPFHPNTDLNFRINAGALFKLKSGHELLAQVSVVHVQKTVAGYAAGYNVQLSKLMELITEIGYRSVLYGEIGFIWTLGA